MAANVSFALSTPFFAMSQIKNHSDSIELPVVDPGPDALEREIASKASKGPRVTIKDIEENIVSEHYFSAADGARFGWLTADHADAGVRERVRSIADSIPTSSHASTSASIDANADTPAALGLLTFCVLVLRNGFTVTGKSACASPENFDAGIGRNMARENAINKIWPLMGYELRSKLAGGAA